MKLSVMFKKLKNFARTEQVRDAQLASADIETSSTDQELEAMSTARVTGSAQVADRDRNAEPSDEGKSLALAEHVEDTWSTSSEGCEVSVMARPLQSDIKFEAPFNAESPLGCLGRFQIKDRLGSGLHGRVFRAFDPELNREVAIKVINPTHHTTQSILAAEARRTSTSHPNLVHIYEVASVKVAQAEVHFMVLDLIKGATLNARMAESVSVTQAVEWIKQIARALTAMHRRGISHLDVQPKNVMIRDLDNQAVVIDVGLERETLSDGSVRAIGGTLAYCSPEQCVGQHVDHRSDVFSLGILMYRLLSSHMPFRGNRERMIWEITQLDPTLMRDHNARVSKTLQGIVFKCLQKLPEHRYQTADELLEDIRCWQQNLPTSARDVSVVDRAGLLLLRHRIATLLVSFLLVLSTLSALYGVHLNSERQRTANALHDTRLLLNKNVRAAVDFRDRAAGLDHRLLLDVEPYYRKVLQDTSDVNHRLADVAEANLQLAFLLWGCSQSQESHKFLEVAEKQFEKLGEKDNPTEDELRLLSVFHMDRVFLHKNLGLPMLAEAELESYCRALEWAQQLKNRNPSSATNCLQLAHAHINMAAALQLQNQFPSARDYRQQGIELLRDLASKDETLRSQLAEVLQNQAALLTMLGLQQDADGCSAEARTLWSSLRQIDQYSVVRCDRLLADGEELVKHKSIHEADRTMREALDVCLLILQRPQSSTASLQAWVDRTLNVCHQLTILDTEHRDAQLDYRSTLTAVDQLHAQLESNILSTQLDSESLFKMKYQLAQTKGLRIAIGRTHSLPILSDLESITLHWSDLFGGAENRVQLGREYALNNQVDRALAMLQSLQESDTEPAELKFDMACVYSLCAESLAGQASHDSDTQSQAKQLARRAINLLRSDQVVELIRGVDFNGQLAGDLRWIATNYPSEVKEIIVLAASRP